jgi:pyruvate,orthophosphate dikinase
MLSAHDETFTSSTRCCHRGCALLSPIEIAEMQTHAVIEAAIETRHECGIEVVPET